MVLDGFGFGIGLVWIIGSSLLVSSFVLCGTTTIVLYGAHHPLWLSVCLTGWFVLWLGFGLGYSDIFGLWQDREIIFWVKWFLDPFPPVNELILGWVFRINSLSK
jgi:hypothetical protein